MHKIVMLVTYSSDVTMVRVASINMKINKLVVSTILILLLTTGILWWMGRVPMCECGYIKLWHGVTMSSENSQHITDWYTPSHVIHGFIFFGLLHLLRNKISLKYRFLIALLIEAGWEILENTPLVIDHYRTATISLDYYGDSILNSLSDIGAMIGGFWLASKIKWWQTLVLALVLEIFVGYYIRDNLTFNIIMLLYPLDQIKHWQMGI
jgi:hypothetical protein